MLKPMLAVAAAVILAGCSQTPATNTTAPMPEKPVSVGRYVIVHSSQIERDTILLDTATGRTWSRVEITDMNDEPAAWDPMPQLNSPADLDALANVHGMKKPAPNSN